MDLIWEMARFFLICLGLGISSFTFIAKTEDTGVGFLKVATAISAVSILLTLVGDFLSFREFSSYFYIHLFSLALMLSVYLYHKDKKSNLMWMIFILQNLSLVYLLYHYSNGDIFRFAYMLAGALFLGIITYAMVLGHWYLVTPRLSEKPLIISMYITWFFLLIKTSITTFSLFNQSEFFNSGTALGAGYLFNWMIFLMRVGWGYLIIGIMSYFAWRLVKMRSIQSATGVLYVMTFFIFVAELLSSYILFKYGLFI